MSFEFKFNPEQIKKFDAELKIAFSKVVNNPRMMGEIGESIVTDVVDQTRNKEKSIPLKSDLNLLKESWIKQRTWLQKYNQTDPTFEDGRSNLTFSGQLLNSLTYRVIGRGLLRGVLEVFFDGIHHPYKGKNKVLGKELTNDELSEYVAKAGRPVVGVRPAIRLRINTIVKTYIKRALVIARLDKN